MGLPPELAFVFGETESVFHRTRVIARALIAENTLALTIEKPGGFQYEAGAATMVFIPGAQAEDSKEFTLASAPYESDLMIAMRIRGSAFKNACYRLKPGDSIMVRDASGSPYAHSGGPEVWLSGGIGITPFRSLLRQRIHDHASLDIVHIHSDSSPASVPFAAEFKAASSTHAMYRFLITLTSESAHGLLKGRISAAMIRTHAPQYAASAFTVVGTDSFVGAMRVMLGELGVSADRIRTERFEGYKTSEY